MVMKIYHKLDYEINYNFGIHYHHRKHHLHHENNCTSKTAYAAQTAVVQKLIRTSEEHNWSSRLPKNPHLLFLDFSTIYYDFPKFQP